MSCREDAKKAIPAGKKKQLFGVVSVDETTAEEKFVQTGISDCQVDSFALAIDVETKINELEASGFVIVNINPVISGSYAFKSECSAKFKAGYGYGYGFSYTDGMLIVARKRESPVPHSKASS